MASGKFEYIGILKAAANGKLPESVDEESDLDFKLFHELVKEGCLNEYPESQTLH